MRWSRLANWWRRSAVSLASRMSWMCACVKGAVSMLLLSKGSAVPPMSSSDGNVSALKLVEGRPSAVRCDAVGGYPPPALDLFVGMTDVTRHFSTTYAAHTQFHHWRLRWSTLFRHPRLLKADTAGYMFCFCFLFIYYSVPDRGSEYCDERACLCVCRCLSVCDHISETTRSIFAKFFLCMLAMTVARSSSDGVLMCYVFPVLWMTSYLHISWGCSTLPPGWGSEARSHACAWRVGIPVEGSGRSWLLPATRAY